MSRATPRHRTGSLADGRGLTAAGDVLLLAVLAGGGAALDLATGATLGLVFAACFGAASVLGAVSVHREDLAASVVAPPLVYLAIALVTGALRGSESSGSLLSRQALEVVNQLILGAPVLLLATAAAALVALVRWLGGRRRHRAGPAGPLRTEAPSPRAGAAHGRRPLS